MEDVPSCTKRVFVKEVQSTLAEGASLVAIHTSTTGQEHHTQEEFLQFDMHFPIPATVQALRGDDCGVSTTLRLCFPLSDERCQEECLVYAFLPVKGVGLRFIVHADFDLIVSR